jgi:dipicolinate synthase subunit A
MERTKNVEHVVLLPIPTTKDNRTVLNTKVYINDVLDMLDGETLVSGYGLPSEFILSAREKGAEVVDLLLDEEFLIENAELTALCTLGIVLCSTKNAPRELSIGIVGYGRIGKSLTKLFLYLGSHVKVFTSRDDTRLELCEWGVASSSSVREANLDKLDILINTAPAVIFDRGAIPHGLRVIDLASGDNFPGILDVEKYPSIPAKMFPCSAGRAWGRAIERYLLGNR